LRDDDPGSDVNDDTGARGEEGHDQPDQTHNARVDVVMLAGSPQIPPGICSFPERYNRFMYTKWYSEDKEFAPGIKKRRPMMKYTEPDPDSGRGYIHGDILSGEEAAPMPATGRVGTKRKDSGWPFAATCPIREAFSPSMQRVYRKTE
jgi:hypothetical protein